MIEKSCIFRNMYILLVLFLTTICACDTTPKRQILTVEEIEAIHCSQEIKPQVGTDLKKTIRNRSTPISKYSFWDAIILKWTFYLLYIPWWENHSS